MSRTSEIAEISEETGLPISSAIFNRFPKVFKLFESRGFKFPGSPKNPGSKVFPPDSVRLAYGTTDLAQLANPPPEGEGSKLPCFDHFPSFSTKNLTVFSKRTRTQR